MEAWAKNLLKKGWEAHRCLLRGGMGMRAYFMAHWRGHQNIALSFLVNGVLFYLALESLLFLVYLLTQRPTRLIWDLPLFFSWLVWWIVGTTRSAIRTLRSGGGITSKILAFVALLFVVAGLVKTASDVLLTAPQKPFRWDEQRGLVND